MKVNTMIFIAVLSVILIACAQQATPQTPSYTVNVMQKSGIGSYLTDVNGRTLYTFGKDTAGKSMITTALLANWPVFYTATVTVPASLNAADFGTTTAIDGSMQTTYKGWPLYYFIKDMAAGNTSGQGLLSGTWQVATVDMQPAPAAPVQAPQIPPSVTVLSAPTSVDGGTSFTISWRVDGPSTTIPHTAVHYDVISHSGNFGLTVTPAASGYKFFTQNFASGSFQIPNTFVATIIAPTQTDVLFYRAHAIVNGNNYWTQEYSIKINHPQPMQPPAAPPSGGYGYY